MRMYDLIKKKRDGDSLSQEEINFFIDGYTEEEIPDYQVAALLMAIYFNRMNDEETLYLTKSMIDSGETVDLSSIKGVKVDKHSTGGVGDTTTLILGPMVAACGVPFVKMSGRGLGHTGGTLDKLESIKNFTTNLSNDDFIRIANEINIAINSQTANITPADKKLYSLRDVTATVDNISLIASSIMSKKLAIESDGIILDVKVGSGAFMKDTKQAEDLAHEMVKIGKNYGRKTMALITNMDQPLGNAIGNSLEIKEAIETLKGNGPEDLYELCLALGEELLVFAKKVDTLEEGRVLLEEVVDSGRAFDKFKEMVLYQGGEVEMVENPDLLPKSKHIIEVKSVKEGYVKEINAEEIGKSALLLGAGRETIDSEIKLGVGIILNKKVDDKVVKGECLAYIHTDDLKVGEEVKNNLLKIYKIGQRNLKKQKLILEKINSLE